MIALDPWAWAALGVAAVVIGISKTALPGANILAIALFAAVLPARTSTAAMLLLLMVGDVFALLAYRRHAHWPTLLRLAPAVVLGMLAGFAFLALAGDGVVRRAIGVILLLMIGITLWRRWRQHRSESASAPSSASGSLRAGAAPGSGSGSGSGSLGAGAAPAAGSVLLAGTYGTLGGFTTMVANAGGPVMSMYFLATRTPVQVFLGTTAWFFAIINVTKVPFLAGIGLFHPPVLLMDAVLAPFVVVGALVGLAIAKRLDQRLFDRLVITLTIAGALYLLF